MAGYSIADGMPGLELMDTRRGRLTSVHFLERAPRPFSVRGEPRERCGPTVGALRGSRVALGNSVDGDRAARADEPYHAPRRAARGSGGDGGTGVE